MNKKIKWFAKYLYCEFAARMDNDCAWHVRTLSPRHLENLESSIECGFEFKLILKELKDITDEDLRLLNSDIKNPNVEWTKSKVDNDFPYRLYYIEEIDFLRSKGYAVGIPREFYITQEEMEGMA